MLIIQNFPSCLQNINNDLNIEDNSLSQCFHQRLAVRALREIQSSFQLNLFVFDIPTEMDRDFETLLLFGSGNGQVLMGTDVAQLLAERVVVPVFRV